jgi:acyl carrier protein
VPEVLRLEIEKKIKTILAAELAVSPVTLADTSPSTPLLGRGIGLDSIETTALVVVIEKEYEISVPDSDLTIAIFATIGTLTEYILGKIAERAAAENNGLLIPDVNRRNLDKCK